MELFDIIKLLENTASSKSKLSILNDNKGNEQLKIFFKYALDPKILFWQKKIPVILDEEYENFITFEEALSRIIQLSQRKVTGNNAIDFLYETLKLSGYKLADIISRIVLKDPRCKISATTVNKIWKNLIPEIPFMLCERMNENALAKITFPAFIQEKADGMRVQIFIAKNSPINNERCDLYIPKDNVVCMTRGGNFLHISDNMKKEFLSLAEYNCIIDGEALIITGDEIKERKIGNGILNKCLQGTASVFEISSIHFHVWDLINIEDFFNGISTKSYTMRFYELENLMKKNPKRISLIDSVIIDNFDDAKAFARKKIREGKEGAILKNMNSVWESKRSKSQVKFKDEHECDLICIGTEPHSKKSDWVGSLICESSDGKLIVSTGSGLSEDDRKKRSSEYIGKIIEFHFNSLITSEKKETTSLFLPIFHGIRLDKSEADSLESIRERITSALISDKKFN